MPSPYYPPMSLKKKKKRKTPDGMLGVQELDADPQHIAGNLFTLCEDGNIGNISRIKLSLFHGFQFNYRKEKDQTQGFSHGFNLPST